MVAPLPDWPFAAFLRKSKAAPGTAPLIQIKHPAFRARTLRLPSALHLSSSQRSIELSEQLHPQAPHHLPIFITAPGETDVLMVVMGIFLVAAVLWVGTLYWRLHSLPERMAHKSEKLQFEVVAILGLLALFTHIHLFWVAGLLLAMIDIPDFGTPLRSIAGSVEKIADTRPDTGADAEQETSLAPASVPPDAAKKRASIAKEAKGGHV
jgi:hypothetical protein